MEPLVNFDMKWQVCTVDSWQLLSVSLAKQLVQSRHRSPRRTGGGAQG